MFYVLESTGQPEWNPGQAAGEADLFTGVNYAAPDFFFDHKMAPGDFFRLHEGIFQCVRLRSSTGARGDLVTTYQNAAARVATITSATKDLLTCSGAAFTVNDLIGKFVYVKTGTGIGQWRRILENDATTIRVSRYFPQLQLAAASAPNAFTTLPVNTDTLVIVGYDEVAKTAAVGENVQGVIVATSVTQDYFTIIQVAGPALIKMRGDTDPVTALGTLVPSSTAGVAKGPTTAGETAAEARLSFAMSFEAYTGTTQLHFAHLFGNKVVGGCAPKLRAF